MLALEVTTGPTRRANSSISAMRPPCYYLLEEIVMLGVIYGSLVWMVCNPAATAGPRGIPGLSPGEPTCVFCYGAAHLGLSPKMKELDAMAQDERHVRDMPTRKGEMHGMGWASRRSVKVHRRPWARANAHATLALA